jgi:hypothetical protein
MLDDRDAKAIPMTTTLSFHPRKPPNPKRLPLKHASHLLVRHPLDASTGREEGVQVALRQ